MLAKEAMAGTERSFRSYFLPITNVKAFKYLGCILTTACDEWPAAVAILWNAQKKWEWMPRILGREGAYLWAPGKVFKEVMQSVLLLRPETWVVPPHVIRTMVGFQHSVDRWLTGNKT